MNSSAPALEIDRKLSIDDIIKPVAEDFKAAETLIEQSLQPQSEMAATINGHVIRAGGKRLRPLACLLAAAAVGEVNPRQRRLAAAVEYLHTATLLHDDVIDDATSRRGRPSANRLWGDAHSVLAGDVLYAKSIAMLLDLEAPRVLREMTEVSGRLAEAELRQLSQLGERHGGEEAYFELIRDKTAILFGAATRCAAWLGDADEAQAQALGRYGDELGICFQIVDDLLDYCGDESRLGKPVGGDFDERKMTLPLIYALQDDSEEARRARRAFDADTPIGAEDWQRLRALIAGAPSRRALRKAEAHSALASQALQSLPPSAARESLTALAEMAARRQR